MTESYLTVHARWDEEAGVYHAWSDDIIGLATEADTLEKLKKKLSIVVPELIALNDHTPFDDHKDVPLCLLTEDNFTVHNQA